jgi:RHS repeat-associated protein
MRKERISSTRWRLRTLAVGIVSCVGWALPAAAADVWRGAGLNGAVAYFASPIGACEYQFAQVYLPVYVGHVRVTATENYDIGGRLASVECIWHDTDGGITPILTTYGTLVCTAGIPVANEPWCPPVTPIGDSCPAPARGNPIAVLTGEKIQRERDFATADGRLYFERTYRSGGISRGRLGRRWRTNFDRNLIKPSKSGTATLELGDGRIARFYNTGTTTNPVFYPARPVLSGGVWTGAWTATATNYRTDQSWSFAKSGTNWVFTDEDGTVEVYDASFRITSITFRGGYSWTYAYDAGGRNTSVTDSLGRAVTFAYLDTGVLASATMPDGSVWRFAYAEPYPGSLPTAPYLASAYTALTAVIFPDATPATTADNPRRTYHYEDPLSASLLTGITDERGVRIRTWDYDAESRGILATGHAGANDYAFTFNAGSTVVTNPFGRQETFSKAVGSQGVTRLSQIAGSATAHVAAATEGYQYDANGYLSQATDAEGRVTTFVRNARGLPTSRTDGHGTPSARTVAVSWHAAYRVPTQIVEPGLTTNATYDAAGRLTQLTLVDTTSHTVPYSTNGQTRTWTYTYTAAGLLDTVNGPLSGAGDVIDFDYDAAGHLAAVTDEVGLTTTVTSVDGAGRPLSVTDPNGVVTAYTYTPRGWLATITVQPGASQRRTEFEYDAAGHVVEVTLPTGGTLSYTWDDAGRVIEVEDSFGQTMSLEYDEMDQVTERSFSTSGGTLRSTVSRTYDEIGRLLSTIGAASETETRAYDRTGNLTQVTDPRGEAWSTSYDAINRVIAHTDPESHSVQYGYDGRNGLSQQTDGRGLQTAFVRNGFGDVIQETSPDRGVTTYVYSAAGLVTQRTDAAGVVTQLTYDDAGRLTGKAFPSPALDQTFTYDATASGNQGAGRLTGVSDAFGTRTFVYSAFGDLVRETRTINGHSYQTDYTYSAGGEVAQITSPTGRQVRFVRDAHDRVTAVETRANSGAAWSSVASNVAWRPFGPLESLDYGHGLGLDLSYDQNGWLTGIDVAGAGTTVVDLAFTRDAAGALTASTDAVTPSRSATYDYTDAGRLETATGPWGTLSWLYDAAGNRTRETRVSGGTTTQLDSTYPATSNRLSEIRDGAGTLLRDFLYRPNGQVSEDDRGASGVSTFGYDADGRLAEARLNGAVVATYGYDAAGRRIVRAVAGSPGASREYLYFPDGRLQAEADGSGAIVREYVWLDDLPLAAVDVSGAGSTLYYIHAGHRGEPLAMTDAWRAKVWDAAYEPFGAATVFTATTPLDLRLPGQQLQAETGLHQNWMRDYDPTLGRYLQPDPIGLDGGPHVYSYTGQDPLNLVDPQGTLPWAAAAGLGAAIGFGMELINQTTDGREGINWGRVGTATLFGAGGGVVGKWIGTASMVPLSRGAGAALEAFLRAQLGTMKGMIDLLWDPCLNGGEHILRSALLGVGGGLFGQLTRR